jgi:hypothetical protein
VYSLSEQITTSVSGYGWPNKHIQIELHLRILNNEMNLDARKQYKKASLSLGSGNIVRIEHCAVSVSHIPNFISFNTLLNMKAIALLALALSPLAFAQSLCDQYAYHASNGYEFNNNMWGQGSGQGSQCTYVSSTSGNGVSWRVNWNWSGGENNVKSYPYSGRQLSQKRIISQIGSLPTSASWAYSGTNIRANVAYDLFTAADPNHSTSSGDYELMIWYVQWLDLVFTKSC